MVRKEGGNSSTGSLPVEGYVVLGHELVVSDVIGILPPFLPLARVIGSDADVPDGSIEPNVEHLQQNFTFCYFYVVASGGFYSVIYINTLQSYLILVVQYNHETVVSSHAYTQTIW